MSKNQNFTVRDLNERIRTAKRRLPGDIDAQTDDLIGSLSGIATDEKNSALRICARMAVARVGASDRTRIYETFPSEESVYLYGEGEPTLITESEINDRLGSLDDGEKLSFLDQVSAHRSGRLANKVSALRKNLRRYGTTQPSRTTKEEWKVQIHKEADRAIQEVVKVVRLANIAKMLDRQVSVRGQWKMLIDCQIHEVEWLAEQATSLTEGAIGEAAFYTTLAENMREFGVETVRNLAQMEEAA